ncbi:hypothetical protein BGX34_007346 [Mortierella sp. NVP85]|nr:hypothetical protein BGX34_007346 [Mortierella sp. NVP85]
MLIDSLLTWATVAVTLAQEASQWKVPDNKIRVAFQIGQDGHQGNSGLGGQIPTVHIQDVNTRFLAMYYNTGSDWIDAGANKVIDVDMARSSELWTLSVKMENDNTSLDNAGRMLNANDRTGAVPGDLFWLCGLDWTYSGFQVNGTELRCGWLDGDNTTGNAPHVMYLNTDIMGQKFVKNFVQDTPGNGICEWGVFFARGASPKKKRAIKDTYGKRAFVTANGGAIELCDSPTSRGKSMLSLKEGIFCDVLTKTKVPLCRGRKRDGCFKYERHVDENGRPQRSMTFIKPTFTLSTRADFDLTHHSYDLDYFVISDISGRVIDNGTGI